MQFALLPLQGFTQGGQPIIHYNYGAKNPQRVKKAFKLQTICCVSYSMFLWAAVELFPSAFVAVFTDDPQLSQLSCWALRIYMASAGLMGLQTTCQQTFIAFRRCFSKKSSFLAILRKIILLIPFIFILPQFIDKVLAVFLAEPIADVIAVTTTLLMFSIEAKRITEDQNKTPDI